jgi:hypothetical protein
MNADNQTQSESTQPNDFKEFLESLSPEQIEDGMRQQNENISLEMNDFSTAYARGECYLCNCAFDQILSNEPCIHWLLRRGEFKKKDFPKIYNKYGYHQIATFLRWCANAEVPQLNINDLDEEKEKNKVISYTIKWMNIEWTFDCVENDLQGHLETGTSESSRPHYHFQMRIDGGSFIGFNQFHVPFHDEDLSMLSLHDDPNFRQSFGVIGAGMQDAMSIDKKILLEHAIPSKNENEAQYNLLTIIKAKDGQLLSGEDIQKMLKESKSTNKTVASVAQKQFEETASVIITVSPSEAVPDIASRTKHKPR